MREAPKPKARRGAGPPTWQEFEISQRSVMLSVQGAATAVNLARHVAAKTNSAAEREDFTLQAESLKADVEGLLAAMDAISGAMGAEE